MTVARCSGASGRPRRRIAAALLRQDSGSYSIVEAVITLPVLLMFTMFVVQYALLWHARHVAEGAVQNAVRTASSYNATAAAGYDDAAQYLRQVAPNLLPHPQIQVNRAGTTVRAHVHAGVLSVVPFGSFSVDESAAAPIERFIAPDGS